MPNREFLGLDLETAKSFPTGEDWKDHRPLGIACAATASDRGHTRWFGRSQDGDTNHQMSMTEASELVEFLMHAHQDDMTIVTWNGIGFDWQVLAEESGRAEDCRILANAHVDMMYLLFCIKGYPLGLAAAAAGMHVGGKTDGVTGAKAPEMWAEGQHKQVIEYCVQDAELTLEIANACQQQRQLSWIARSGRPNSLALPEGWQTVQDARHLPLPNTSWIDNPMSRQSIDGWLGLDDQAPLTQISLPHLGSSKQPQIQNTIGENQYR